jgi:hypothetical protein
VKRLILLPFLAASLVIGNTSIGSAQFPIQTTGTLMSLTIEQNGTIRSNNGTLIGNIQQDGTVRNANGSIVGNIQENGTVRDYDGYILGNIHPNGTLRNANDYIVGNVQDNGTVRDANGSVVNGVNGRKGAIVYFFFKKLWKN